MVIEWVSIVMEVPPNGWLIKGKSHLEMDDDWGYPYDSGNPPLCFPYFSHKDLMLQFAEGGGVRLGYSGALCGITCMSVIFYLNLQKKHQSKEDKVFLQE